MVAREIVDHKDVTTLIVRVRERSNSFHTDNFFQKDKPPVPASRIFAIESQEWLQERLNTVAAEVKKEIEYRKAYKLKQDQEKKRKEEEKKRLADQAKQKLSKQELEALGL